MRLRSAFLLLGAAACAAFGLGCAGNPCQHVLFNERGGWNLCDYHDGRGQNQDGIDWCPEARECLIKAKARSRK